MLPSLRVLLLRVGLVAAGLAYGSLFAQEQPGPAEPFQALEDLRAAFEEELDGAGRSAYEAFSAELRQLELAAAGREDYEQARRAQDRRRELREFLGMTGSEIPKWREDAAVTLDLSQSQRSAGVQWSAREGALGPWKTVASDAQWDLTGLDPQVYDVEITYSCGKTPPSGTGTSQTTPVQAGGELEFGEVTGLIGASSKPIRYEVKPTEGWDDYRTERIGSLEFKARIARLRLAARFLSGESLMQVKRIRLLPTVPRGSSRPAVRDLAGLEASFREAVATRGEEVRDAYLSELEVLEKRARDAGDENLVQRIIAERQSVLLEPLPPAVPKDVPEASTAPD